LVFTDIEVRGKIREDGVVYKALSISELGLYAESPPSYTEAGDGFLVFLLLRALGGRVERFRRSSNVNKSLISAANVPPLTFFSRVSTWGDPLHKFACLDWMAQLQIF